MTEDEIARAVAWAEEIASIAPYMQPAIANVARALLALKAERDAALADARRLDWLESQGVRSVLFTDDTELNPASVTLRAAIDACMAADRLAEEGTDASA